MRAAWAWAAVVAAIRVLVAALTMVPARDADAYLWMAERAAGGDLGALFGTVFHPVYPALCAVPLALFPGLDPFRAGQLVACLGAALAAVPLWKLALRLSNGDRGAAHLTCLAYALGVWFARHPADALSEGVFFPLAAWSVERLCAAHGRIGPVVVAGLLAGLAYGTRPEGAALWICGAPWLFLRGERRGALALTAAFGASAVIWPIGWAAFGPGFTLTPKAAFNWDVGAGSADAVSGHYFIEFARLCGMAFDAIGFLVLPAAFVGIWRTRPRHLRDDAALPLAIFSLQFLIVPLLRGNVRFLAGYGILLLPFAGIGLRTIGARLGVRRPIAVAGLCAIVFAGDLVRLPQPRRTERIVVQELGAWLGERLAPGETIASDMPRLVWAAGLPPIPPRRVTREEILTAAGAPNTRFVAIVGARTAVTPDELAALGYAPVALPPELAEKSQARGLIVMRK